MHLNATIVLHVLSYMANVAASTVCILIDCTISGLQFLLYIAAVYACDIPCQDHYVY